MLTALSVARDCGMIEQCAKVIVINMDLDGSKDRKPSITFTLANKQVGEHTLQ